MMYIDVGTIFIEDQILRLDVPMKYTILVQVL